MREKRLLLWNSSNPLKFIVFHASHKYLIIFSWGMCSPHVWFAWSETYWLHPWLYGWVYVVGSVSETFGHNFHSGVDPCSQVIHWGLLMLDANSKTLLSLLLYFEDGISSSWLSSCQPEGKYWLTMYSIQRRKELEIHNIVGVPGWSHTLSHLVTEFTYVNHYSFILILQFVLYFPFLWLKKLLKIHWYRRKCTRKECYGQVGTQGLVFHTPLFSLYEHFIIFSCFCILVFWWI